MQFVGLVILDLYVMLIMVDFTDKQKRYINSGLISENIYLEACPGSGKTEVIAAKVAKEISKWDKSPGGMAILSFTNSATDELKTRIAKYTSGQPAIFPHFVGTFDSFILKYLVSPIAHEYTGYKGNNGDFSISIVENSSNLFIQTKYSYANRGKVKAHHFDHDLKDGKLIFNTGDQVLDRTLNALDLADWQIKDLLNAKQKFQQTGFATYKDIEVLAVDILTDTDVSIIGYLKVFKKRFPLLIVDECQDLSFEQLVILNKLIEFGIVVHLIGDLNQAIYEFRNSKPEYIEAFIDSASFVTMELGDNHRSVQPIVDICTALVNGNKINGRNSAGIKHAKVLQYINCPTEVLPDFVKISNNHATSVIVARGHSVVAKFNLSYTSLKDLEKLATSLLIFDPDSLESISIAITLMSEYLRVKLKESVKPNSFNCPESIDSSFQWRKFIFELLTYLKANGLTDGKLTWKNWCKSVKAHLRNIHNYPFVNDEIASILSKLKEVNLSAPKGKGDVEISYLLANRNSSIQTFKKTTIHQVKGESHDVTMLVSSKTASGGTGANWKEWLKCTESEAARFAYVASSRPKEILIWAVPKLVKTDEKILEDLGFEIC